MEKDKYKSAQIYPFLLEKKTLSHVWLQFLYTIITKHNFFLKLFIFSYYFHMKQHYLVEIFPFSRKEIGKPKKRGFHFS